MSVVRCAIATSLIGKEGARDASIQSQNEKKKCSVLGSNQ